MIAALLLVASIDSSSAAPVPAKADTVSSRVVVRLKEFLVEGVALHDPLSSESVRRLPSRALRRMPLNRLGEVVALGVGVVARGEDLHVRGGRNGEFVTQLQGVPLNEPLRGRAFEVPLIAVRDADVVTGGLDAEYGGALAGVLVVRTFDPGDAWGGEIRWQTDGRLGTHYDHAGARLGGPIGSTGLGVVASVEAELDDAHLPALRTPSRRELLGGSFGWRADNRLRGYAKLVKGVSASRVALEVLANRRVDRPYDPAWSLDGYVNPCADPAHDCITGPAFSATPAPGYERYNAADHLNITDTRSVVSILSWQRVLDRGRASASLGWARSRAIDSIDGHDDESQLAVENFPVFGIRDSTVNDPFHVYLGDEPFFRKSASDQISLRGDFERSNRRGSNFQTGAGAKFDDVSLRELDVTTLRLIPAVDSLRTYHASAPGVYGYGQFRWITEGLVLNGGLRVEYFTAGKDAVDPATGRSVPGLWSFSPRLGIAYPISVRDVFSLSYSRVQQNPWRDYLYDSRKVITNRRPLGNAALEPTTLVSYQAAIKHLLGRGYWLQAAYFYRDLFGMIGARDVRASRFALPVLRYQNADDASATGTEVTLVTGDGGPTRVELNYTYMIARGTFSLEEGVPYGPRLAHRPESLGQHALDWDRRHAISLSAFWQGKARVLGSLSAGWTTQVGSGLPWSPREFRAIETDLSLENTARFGWDESSAAALRWSPRGLRQVTLGVDVRNVFDHRGAIAATVDGFPNPVINTLDDEYGAFRTATGLGGGAYYNDGQWVRVHDPRLDARPREIRFTADATW